MRNVNLFMAVTMSVLLGTLLALPARGAEPMPCPGALAWNQGHPEESDAAMTRRDAARALSDPALRAELDARFERDQEARYAWMAQRSNPHLQARVGAVDADDVLWLNRLVRRQGFPTAAQVGEWGVRHAWLLAQHADREPTFQAALLPALEQRHADGELNGMTLSRFVDRVLVAQHQPQRYGTQFTPQAWATAHFGLPDDQSVRDVDSNRAALGIMPLADYVCMMSWERRPRP